MLHSGKILGFHEIRSILPQRLFLQMVDRAQMLEGERAVGVKGLNNNEMFFQGHFPGQPILPGVLQVEAMKQLAELAVRDELDPSDEFDVYLKRLRKVKFRAPILPGDRMQIEVQLTGRGEQEISFTATTRNSQGVTCEAQLTLGVRSLDCPIAFPALYNEYDRSETTLQEAQQVMKTIPHRYPFLLIDTLAAQDHEVAVATKNVSGDEWFFAHCNGYAAMPESILCEIGAQAGCASVLSREENRGKLGLFAAILSAESLKPVVPGDQMVIKIDIPPAKKSFGKGAGVILVEGEPVFKVELMFAIVDPTP